jgi:hypothetical protein
MDPWSLNAFCLEITEGDMALRAFFITHWSLSSPYHGQKLRGTWALPFNAKLWMTTMTRFMLKLSFNLKFQISAICIHTCIYCFLSEYNSSLSSLNTHNRAILQILMNTYITCYSSIVVFLIPLGSILFHLK